MSKNKFQGHAPRPTKGELVAAAQQQTAKEEKVGELSGPVLALVKEMGNELPTPPVSPSEVVAKPTDKPKETGLYRIGKKYAPKTDRNSATWGKIVKLLANGPKTLKEITEEIKDHKDFLGYMTRGGHVVPFVEEAPKAEEATK